MAAMRVLAQLWRSIHGTRSVMDMFNTRIESVLALTLLPPPLHSGGQSIEVRQCSCQSLITALVGYVRVLMGTSSCLFWKFR